MWAKAWLPERASVEGREKPVLWADMSHLIDPWGLLPEVRRDRGKCDGRQTRSQFCKTSHLLTGSQCLFLGAAPLPSLPEPRGSPLPSPLI